MIPLRVSDCMNTLQFFMHRTWEWSHDHMDMLKSSMTPDDQMVQMGILRMWEELWDT